MNKLFVLCFISCVGIESSDVSGIKIRHVFKQYACCEADCLVPLHAFGNMHTHTRADMLFSQTDNYSDSKNDWMNQATNLGVFITWSDNNPNVYMSTYNLSKVNLVYEEPFFQKYIQWPYTTQNIVFSLFITENTTIPEFLISPSVVYNI